MQVFRIVEVNRVLTWKFYLGRILPVGFFMALTLLFGNIVYLYLTVSFIQMLKVSAGLRPSPDDKHAAIQYNLLVRSRVPLAGLSQHYK